MVNVPSIKKYDRTPHLEDSRLQPGDEDLDVVRFSSLKGSLGTYEEKIDGCNAGFSFDGAGNPLGQSRGHYLNLSERNLYTEKDYVLFKDWLLANSDIFLERYEDRYIVYGEWMAITHSIFYDRLPHYFMEFDTYDRLNECFLDTPSRRILHQGLPIVAVPVLYRGPTIDLAHLKSFVKPSLFISTDASVNLQKACKLVNDDHAKRLEKMDHTGLAEGIYGKLEENGKVVARFKWVRSEFVQVIKSADEHWASRFPVPNLLGGPVVGFPHHLTASKDELPSYDADGGWV